MSSFFQLRLKALFGLTLLALAASCSSGAQADAGDEDRLWKPFKWHYQVSYVDGGKKRSGSGDMELVSGGRDWQFFLRVDSGILNFYEVTKLRIDGKGRLQPLSRRQRSRVLFLKKTREYPLHPRPPEQVRLPFHDSATALLQLVREAGSARRWRFWVADQNRAYDYRARGREQLKTPWGLISADVIEQLEDAGGRRRLKLWVGRPTGGEPVLLRMVRKNKDRILTLDISKPASDEREPGDPGRR